MLSGGSLCRGSPGLLEPGLLFFLTFCCFLQKTQVTAPGKKDKLAPSEPVQSITNNETLAPKPAEEAKSPPALGVVPSSIDVLKTPTALFDKEAEVTPNAIDFDAIDSLIEGKSASPVSSFEEDPRRPIEMAALSPSLDRYGTEFQKESQAATADEEGPSVPGKRFIEIRAEINARRRAFEANLRSRTKAVESSVQKLCQAQRSPTHNTNHSMASFTHSLVCIPFRQELAASPEKKHRELRVVLSTGIESLREKLSNDAEIEAKQVDSVTELRERMSQIRQKVQEEVSKMRVEVETHSSEVKGLVEAKVSLQSEMEAFQRDLYQMQTQLEEDRTEVYGAITGDEPLLAIKESHSLELTRELSDIECEGFSMEWKQLEAQKPHILQKISEAENSLETKLAGEVELNEMREMLSAKLGALGSDLDPDELHALDGEMSGIETKIRMSQEACGLQRKLIADQKAKLVAMEARMSQLTAKQTQRKQETSDVAKAFADRAQALMGAFSGTQAAENNIEAVKGTESEQMQAGTIVAEAPAVEPLVLRGALAAEAVAEEKAEELLQGKLEASTCAFIMPYSDTISALSHAIFCPRLVRVSSKNSQSGTHNSSQN